MNVTVLDVKICLDDDSLLTHDDKQSYLHADKPPTGRPPSTESDPWQHEGAQFERAASRAHVNQTHQLLSCRCILSALLTEPNEII